jgi:hypothetical protein
MLMEVTEPRKLSDLRANELVLVSRLRMRSKLSYWCMDGVIRR